MESSDAELVDACRDLASGGYRLALDVNERTPSEAPLAAAHVLRVDVAGMAPGTLTSVTDRLRAFSARRLATNVQHRGERDRCAALGFDLFEGYRFSAPEVPARKEIGVEQLQAFRVLKLLRDPKSDDREIESKIQGEVGLSYKLLRMVSSAAVGGREIWSIGHALRVLGREQVARWLSVLLVSETGDAGVRAELMQLALVRSRMCEGLADLAGVPKARGSLFLVGLVSVLDQLLEVPMSTLCDAMDLAPDLRKALLQRADFFGSALQLVETYVAGQWSEVERLAPTLSVVPATLQPLYLEALQWATAQSRSQSAA
jgi:EAL and modified HD-GYP domain-containing signal transduction protein